MFTGLIEATATILDMDEKGLTVERPSFFDDVALGSSIAVNGACLSIVELTDQLMRFDVHQETWERTMFDQLSVGSVVNLERAMKANGRFEGHIVQGHVDGCGVNLQSSNLQSSKLSFSYPEGLRGLIVEKGYIAINGVSLTVADIDDDQFSIALIPQTAEKTNLGQLKEGEKVNLEVDVVGRYLMERS